MYGIPDLRQLLYPREFRIDRPAWPADLSALLEQWAQQPHVAGGEPEAGAADASPPVEFLADVCTGLWRLRQRMLQPGTDRPLEEMRRAYRHLESTWDALAQAGVEIIDHTGAPFDAGLAIKVIAYQPTPDATRERVLETLKPTIYFRQERLQMGEVIVSIPERIEPGAGQDHPAGT